MESKVSFGRGRRTTTIVTAALLALLGAVAASPAAASCGGAAVLIGSCFEGGDGNLSADGAPTNADNVDWASLPTASKIRFAEDNTQFTNTSDEQDPTTWDLAAGEPPTSKLDITGATAWIEERAGQTFLHVGFAMRADAGSANVLVELNNKASGQHDPQYSGPLNAFAPDRTQNDALIQFSGNQNQIPRIGLCRWVGTRGGTGDNGTYGWYQVDGTNSVPQASPPANVNPTTGHIDPNTKDCTTLDGDEAIGRVHSTDNDADASNLVNIAGDDGQPALPSPPFEPKLENGRFAEMSINLTGVFGMSATNPCFDFGSIWLHTYNGNSISSILADYVGPKPIDSADNCAIDIDKKVAVNTSDTTPPATNLFIDGTATTSLADTGNWLWYRIAVTNTENVALDAVQLTDPKCQLVDGSGSPSNAPIEKSLNNDSTLDPGETWTYLCKHQLGTIAADGLAYTNTATATATKGTFTTDEVEDSVTTGRYAKVTVVKDAVPDDAQDFTFTPSGSLGSVPFVLDDDADLTNATTKVYSDLTNTGSATVTESPASGWDLDSVSCVNAAGAAVATVATDRAAGMATVDVQPGVDVTCTFINKKVNLVIVKDAAATTVDAGEDVAFTVTTSNAGPGTARGVSVADPLPAGLTWAVDGAAPRCAVSGAPGSQVLTCAYGDLAAGDSRSVTVKATTSYAACATYDNTAIASASNTADVSDDATITCRKPAVTIAKTTSTPAINGGDVARFSVTVKNTGPGTAKDVTVSDLLPAGPTWAADGALPAGCVIGDTNVGGVTRQLVTCSFTTFGIAEVTFGVRATTSVTVCDTYDNTATVAGSNFPAGSSSATVVCRKPDPAISIDKTGPATATAGDGILYTLAVKNTGPTPFPDGLVIVADALCEAPPALISKNGDLTPAFLDPGETWTYTCTVRTLVGATNVHNVASVNGTDVNGKPASDDDDADTVLAQPVVAVAGVKVVSGTAKLRGPNGCLKLGNARSFVTGKQIKSVRFELDGKTVKTVTKPDGLGRWLFSVAKSSLKTGSHRVVAVVTFKAASKTKSRRLQLRFSICGAVKPQKAEGFTG